MMQHQRAVSKINHTNPYTQQSQICNRLKCASSSIDGRNSLTRSSWNNKLVSGLMAVVVAVELAVVGLVMEVVVRVEGGLVMV